jgi:hypothetical protein
MMFFVLEIVINLIVSIYRSIPEFEGSDLDDQYLAGA